MTLRVFVSVGTDHHPFGRLIDWIDDWAEGREDLDLVVQHGASPPSRSGRNLELLGPDRLAAEYRAADIIVSQVGPGTISDANRAGHEPIVVPRDPSLGEVVDGHQHDFGDFMAAQGRCTVARSEQELIAAIESQILRPARDREALAISVSAAADAVRVLVDETMVAPRGGFSISRAFAMLRPARNLPGSSSNPVLSTGEKHSIL